MNHRSIHTPIAASIAMLVLILDSPNALIGAKSGIEMCLQSVIPSLFPFFVLSILLTSGLTGRNLPFLRPLAILTGIPKGSESILLTGLLGGYPVGAQSVSTAHAMGALTDAEASRMLPFCNNAGPAFIFGMTAALLPDARYAWLLWLIQILSTLLTGFLLPGKTVRQIKLPPASQPTIPQALTSSLRIMASVCGWVLLFRVLQAFIQRWVFWLFPIWVQSLLTGLLELANGCFALTHVENIGLRFLLCAGMLSFGGLCVWLQTLSVAGKVNTRLYLPGKLLQFTIATTIALLCQNWLRVDSQINIPMPFFALPAVIIALFFYFRQKSSSIPAKAGV